MAWTNGISCVSPNQNQTPTLGLRETLAPKEEASKVSSWGHAHVQNASQRVGRWWRPMQEVMTPFAYYNRVVWDLGFRKTQMLFFVP